MNKKRHQLLGLLAKEYAKGKFYEGNILDVIVMISTIVKNLNITYDEFIIMSEELLSKNEIEYFGNDNNFDQPALFIKSDGITAFANKKYLKIDNEQYRENIKFWAQLILPVLSFIIAAIALFLNIITQTEVEKVKSSQKFENLK
ncbi:hypothetical protein [Flavobacterium algicola]|uniref:hypothetical protein n=1 Tax=Flavobacterium algicola TaxID=556529 RepID=UPI001EFD7D3F|nr:hypothetical protein [Flavobacterium algicola]MCG9791219.1 hypothetical protein [Flavobacterium algicola]